MNEKTKIKLPKIEITNSGYSKLALNCAIKAPLSNRNHIENKTNDNMMCVRRAKSWKKSDDETLISSSSLKTHLKSKLAYYGSITSRLIQQ